MSFVSFSLWCLFRYSNMRVGLGFMPIFRGKFNFDGTSLGPTTSSVHFVVRGRRTLLVFGCAIRGPLSRGHFVFSLPV